MKRRNFPFPRVTAPAVAALALAACGGDGADSTQTQVVARVNDAEITVTQLRTALFSKGEMEPTADSARQVLEGLVNEQLLVDSALRNELDRDPTVVQAIETARRQLLANAYVERMVFPQEGIGVAEQADYFKAHPELFAKRRVYQLSVYSCPGAELPDALMEGLDAVSTTEDIDDLLTDNGLVCDVQSMTRAAEQLAIEQLPQFASADVGDVLVQTQPPFQTVLTLVTGVQSSPITFESAQPIIQQYLTNVRNAEALDAHLKQARAVADITHVDSSFLAANPEAPAELPESEARRDQSDGAAILN